VKKNFNDIRVTFVNALPVVLYQEKRNGIEKVASDGANGMAGSLPLLCLFSRRM
jgi:hypothetical protein